MTHYHVQEYSPYTAQQIYDLVMDIERYPEFIPWCRAARVVTRLSKDAFLGELVIAFKHIRESYVSRVTGDPETLSIDVVMERGPFEHLTNQWQLIPQDTGCLIDFHIDFAFKSRLLEKVIGALFGRATQKMVQAFQDRAHALYGDEA